MIEKNNLQQTLDRYLAFVERRLGRGILANVVAPPPTAGDGTPPADAAVEIRECLALANLDDAIDRAVTAAGHCRDFLADVYPRVYPTLDFGESVWSGFFGAPISFAGTSRHTWSYCPDPPLKDLARFAFPPVDPANHWYRKMIEVTAHYVQRLPPVCDIVGYPPAWTIVKDLKQRLAPVPISVGMPREAFAEGLRQRRLPAGVLYHVTANSLADANRLMEQVFDYRG